MRSSFLVRVLLALSPLALAVPAAHATEGCNSIGWDEPHGMTGCNLYYPAVTWMYGQGIASGDANTGAYHPERPVNRAEFTKLTLLASGVGDASPCVAAPFPDVPVDAWYAPYVCEAVKRGIIGGFPDGTFKPAIDINFANGSKILAKTFAIPIDYDDANVDTMDGKGAWYRPYTMALLNKKAVAETIGRFDQSIDRGEMAEMLYRLKTGKTSIAAPPAHQDPEAAEYDDVGMGYESHVLEFALGFYLDSEPDPPFVFSPDAREYWLPSEQTTSLHGYAFSHVLQQERCTESGLFDHCRPTFTDWAVGMYVTHAPVDLLEEGMFEPRFERYFGGKKGTCWTTGIEGENTEWCIVPWNAGKTLVVSYDYIAEGTTTMPGLTPQSFSDAMYARIRKGMHFTE